MTIEQSNVVRFALAQPALPSLTLLCSSLAVPPPCSRVRRSHRITPFALHIADATRAAHSTIVLANVVREAGLLLGGMGLTKGGAGARIERIYREVNALMTPG